MPKIRDLPDAATVAGGDFIPLAQTDGSTRKVTLSMALGLSPVPAGTLLGNNASTEGAPLALLPTEARAVQGIQPPGTAAAALADDQPVLLFQDGEPVFTTLGDLRTFFGGSAPPAGDSLFLLEDGSGFWMLEDGTGYMTLEA